MIDAGQLRASGYFDNPLLKQVLEYKFEVWVTKPEDKESLDFPNRIRVGTTK